nr:unnamed protein product [Callosobruchus analis]
MLCESNKIFAPLKKGTNVLIRVPDVDRGRLTPRNILAIVSEMIDDGLYELCTENGPLHRLFSRNELLQTDSQFMPEADNIYDKKTSLRTAANMSSKGSGQDFDVTVKDFVVTLSVPANNGTKNVTPSATDH